MHIRISGLIITLALALTTITTDLSTLVKPTVRLEFRGVAADFVVTDPMGRRVGDDRLTSTKIIEIEGASYENLETGIHQVIIPSPTTGTYIINVIGDASGLFQIEITSFADDGSSKKVYTQYGLAKGEEVRRSLQLFDDGTLSLEIPEPVGKTNEPNAGQTNMIIILATVGLLSITVVATIAEWKRKKKRTIQVRG